MTELTPEQRETLADHFASWFTNGDDYGREEWLADADRIAPVIAKMLAEARAEALGVAATLLGKVVDYWDGRPTAHHGHHIEADLRDVLRAIERDRDHNRGECGGDR